MADQTSTPTTGASGASSGGSMESAFASSFADSSSAPTSTATTPSDQAASPTVTPDGQPAPAGTNASTTNEPPKERWDTILANARQKEAARVEAEWRQRVGWAEGVTPDQVRELQELAQWREQQRRDPVSYVAQLWQELQEHPQFAQAMRSQAARILAARQQAANEDTEPQPDLQSQDERGNIIPVYSAAQQARREAWLRRQIESGLAQRLQPLEQIAQQQQQAQAAQAWNQWAEQTATQELSFAREHWDGFKDLEPKIGALMRQYPQATLEQAYIHVYQSEVLPTYREKAKADALADLQTKAHASTDNPAASSATRPVRPRSFEEAFAQLEKGA